jgi:Flp pilus assembly protein TadB
MAEIDYIKVRIAFHEKILFASLAIVFGLLGWIATNYLTAHIGLILAAMLGMLTGAFFTVRHYKKFKQQVKEIRYAE